MGLVPGESVSKYKSRGLFGALGGPTVGLVDDVHALLSKMMSNRFGEGEDPLTTKDAQRLMRLMPFQNLFYLYRINRLVTNKAALGLGLEDAG